MNPIIEAVLAVATLAGAVALLALAEWLTKRWGRSPAPAPVREVLVAVPVRPGTDRVPYDTGGVYKIGTDGDDAT